MIQPKNILIVRTDRIGDVVLSLPIANIIKKYFPDCKVTFLVKNYTKSLVENHPYINNVILLKEEGKKVLLKESVKEITRFKFDSAIIVSPNFVTALIIFLSRIKIRIGTGYRWYSFLFNRKVFEHRKYAEKHELEFNLDLLSIFGIQENIKPDSVKFDLKPSVKSKEFVEKVLSSNSVSKNKPIIIVHPGSGGSAIDLPLYKFKELVKLLYEKLNASIIITGQESEKGICEELKLNENIKNFAGKFNLSEMVALINKSSIFISNSTGPIHIAAALGKYTIGFYPKILSCSPKRWGPYTNKKSIFIPEINCSNCTREQCERLDCMSSINISSVFNQVDKIYQDILINGEFNV
jgi:lipopolysaccharide heptosyltransferase II